MTDNFGTMNDREGLLCYRNLVISTKTVLGFDQPTAPSFTFCMFCRNGNSPITLPAQDYIKLMHYR